MVYYVFCVQVPIPNLQPRQGHCFAAFSPSPGITEVVIFGGNTSYPATADGTIADTKVLRFGECKSVVALDECSKPQINKVKRSHMSRHV